MGWRGVLEQVAGTLDFAVRAKNRAGGTLDSAVARALRGGLLRVSQRALKSEPRIGRIAQSSGSGAVSMPMSPRLTDVIDRTPGISRIETFRPFNSAFIGSSPAS